MASAVPSLDSSAAELESSADLSALEQDQFPTIDGNFPLFPSLSIELRLIILQMALPGPRCIKVTLRMELRGVLCTATTNEKSPATLFTSRESRQVALEHYDPFQHGNPPHYSGMTAYIAPLRDILFCSPGFRYSAEEVTKIIPRFTRLAVDSFELVHTSYLHVNIQRIGKLKELIVFPYFMAHTLGNFEDTCEEIWDAEIARTGLDARFLQINDKVEGIFKRKEKKTKSHEAWVAPRLRIGRFVGAWRTNDTGTSGQIS